MAKQSWQTMFCYLVHCFAVLCIAILDNFEYHMRIFSQNSMTSGKLIVNCYRLMAKQDMAKQEHMAKQGLAKQNNGNT